MVEDPRAARRCPVFPYFPFPLPEEPPAEGRLASAPAETDARLALAVAERLRRRLVPGAYRIVVEVQNGVVIIDGTVDYADLRSLVTDEVWATPGVFDVSNRLRVTGGDLPARWA
jgi:hypothetical protein